MKINKKDFNKLCEIARKLNDFEECDVDLYEVWEDLNDIIENIEE